MYILIGDTQEYQSWRCYSDGGGTIVVVLMAIISDGGDIDGSDIDILTAMVLSSGKINSGSTNTSSGEIHVGGSMTVTLVVANIMVVTCILVVHHKDRFRYAVSCINDMQLADSKRHQCWGFQSRPLANEQRWLVNGRDLSLDCSNCRVNARSRMS